MAEDKKKAGDAPDGFDTNVGAERGNGWLEKEPGVTICGRLLGRHIMKGLKDDDGKARVFYQVQLNAHSGIFKKEGDAWLRTDLPIRGTMKDPTEGRNAEAKEVKFKVDDIVNIGEHKALEELAAHCADGSVNDVWFRYMAEQKLQGTQTFWVLSGPKLKNIKPPTRRAEPSQVKREDDIPF